MTDEETYLQLREDYRIRVDLQLSAMDGLSLNDYLDVALYAKMVGLRLATIASGMNLSDFITQSVHRQTDAKLLRLKRLSGLE